MKLILRRNDSFPFAFNVDEIQMTNEPILRQKDASTVSWSRRLVLGALSAIFSVRGWPDTVFAQESERAKITPAASDVQFEWELPRRYAGPTARNLRLGSDSIRRSPNDTGSRGGPVIVIIAGVVALILLMEAVVRLYRDLTYGGIVIEDDGRRLVIRNNPRLPGHVIIIRDKNGRIATKELSGPVSAGQLVRALPRNAPGGRPGGGS